MKIEIEKKWLEILLKRAKNVEIAYTSAMIDSGIFTTQFNQLLGYISSIENIIGEKKK